LGVKDIVTRKVGVFAVVGMFYSMCCAGAFGIEELIPETGPGLAIVMLIVLPFVWALPYSYLCAELGSARPVEGGNIVWVKEALGEFWFGIMVFVNFIWGLVANTVYVVLAVDYLGALSARYHMPLENHQAYLIKVGLILIFFVVNMLGIKEVGFVNTAISIAVLVAFLLVAIYGFMNWQSSPFEPFMSDTYDGALLPTLGAGLAIGIWMYSGFDQISLTAGEIKDSARVIPKALMIVIPLMIVTYVLPTIGGLASVGSWEDWTTNWVENADAVGYQTVLFDYAPIGVAIFFIIVAIFGQCSIFNMCVAVAARSSLILSDEHLGPQGLAKLTRKRGTPWVSLVVVVIVTWALLGTPENPNSFTFLVVLDVFFSVIVCGLTAVSAYILKRRIPEDEIPFKVPGGKNMHTLFVVLVLAFCVLTLLLNGTDYFVGGLIMILAIPIIYVICKKIWKGVTVNEPEAYPIDARTGLGFGDLKKLGGYFVGFGIFGVIGRLFLSFYEADWGPGTPGVPEAEVPDLLGYESIEEAQEDLGDLLYQDGDGTWYVPGYYERSYEGTGFFSNWEGMLQVILWVGVAAIVAGIVIYLFGKKLDKEAEMAA
jgi:amino acid transporter